ncbi:hypothetical protein BST61_g2850 [Cercospora zeina]
MQSVPDVLLPQLQQQVQSQEQAGDGRPGTESKGGSGVPGAKGVPSVSLATGHGLRPPQPSFFDEASRESSPRRSSQESPALLGRGKLSRDDRADTQETALYRPESGPGAEPPSPWSCASSQVSPQLVGGGAGADAGFLISSPDRIIEYKAQMRSLLARSSFPRSSISVHPPTPRSQHSHQSSSTISSITSRESYASSYAYVFRRSKPDLRLFRKRSKPPQHLKPRPLVATKQAQVNAPPRTPGPKVVEDSGFVESTTKHIFPPPEQRPIALTLPELLKAEPPPKPLRKVQTFRLKSLKVEGRQSAHMLKSAASRPALSRGISPQSLDLAATPPSTGLRMLRFEEAHEDGPVQRAPRDSRIYERRSRPGVGTRPSQHSGRNSSSKNIKGTKKHYHDVTFPQEEQDVVNESMFRQGDSYFQTWDPETMFCKEFVPLRTPVSAKDRAASDYFVSSPESSNVDSAAPMDLQPQRSSTMKTTASVVRKRMSGSILSLLRKSTFKEGESESRRPKASRKYGSRQGASSAGATESPGWSDFQAPPLTPGITLSSPAGSKGERTHSILPELHSPSYFGRPRLLRHDSTKSLTPSPGHRSPGHTSHMESKAQSRTPSPLFLHRRHHKRSSSEALSPMSRPQRRSPLVNSSPSESEVSAGQASPGFVAATPGSLEAEVGTRKMGDRQSPQERSMNAVMFNTHSDLRTKPSQALTFQEPVLRKKNSAWKNLVNGLRKVSSLAFLKFDRGSSPERGMDREPGLMSAKKSFTTMKLRASLSSINVRNGRLVRKTSRGSELRLEAVDSEDEDEHAVSHEKSFAEKASPEPRKPPPIRPEDLLVTHFEQTPYSKRYYDSIRAEQQAIRAFVEETMEEDDEECDEAVLGFEQNVPDHLPKSPLCPLHVKHKSGGKAICPLHGRYKPAKRPPSPMHKMEIVYDTREGDRAGATSATQSSTTLKPTTGIDGTDAYLKRAAITSQQTFRTADNRRRMQQTSSMGSDGAESFELSQSAISLEADAWSRPRRRRVHYPQRRSSECARGRTLFRGESAVDIRKRRARQYRERC